MNFQPAAWQMRRAWVAHEAWNAEFPDRIVPWEWVEEMLLSWRSWKEYVGHRPDEALEYHSRYQEFAGKLPPRLVTDIFPQVTTEEL